MHSSLPYAAKGLRQCLAVLRAQRRRLVNFGLAGGASVIVAVCALAVLALTTRGLGSADFGIFVAIQALVALCGAICATESWQSLCRLGCERGVDLPYLCRQALVLDGIAAMGAFVLALGILFLATPLAGLDADYRNLAAIYALSLLAGLTGAARGFFRLRDRFDIIAANQVLQAVLSVLLAAMLLWQGADLSAYIYGFTALAIAYKLQLLAAMLWHLRKEERGGRQFRFGQIARMSLGVSILTTLINARRNVAILVVSLALGPVATGLFGAAMKCTSPLARMGEMIKQVLFADAIRAFRKASVPPDRLHKLRVVALALLAAVVMGAAMFGLVAEPVLGLLLGDEFRAAAAVLVLLLLVEGVQLAGSIFNPVLQARGGTLALSIVYGVALGLFVAGALIWGAQLGASGIAALLLATFLGAYLTQFALVFGPRGLVRKGALS